MRTPTESQNSDNDRGANTPVSPRRVTQRLPRTTVKAPGDDFPVLIRLPDIGRKQKKSLSEKPTAESDLRDAVVSVSLTRSLGSIPQPPEMPASESLSSTENHELAESQEQDGLETTRNRRRRRTPEPEPASWREIAVQWAIILGIVVSVATVFHFTVGSPKQTPSTPNAAANSEENQTTIDAGESTLETAAVTESTPVAEPTASASNSSDTTAKMGEPTPAAPRSDFTSPTAPTPTPATNDTWRSRREISNAESEPTPAAPAVTEPAPAFESTSRYPATNPNTYWYRPGSTINGELPSSGNLDRGYPSTDTGANSIGGRAIQDESVRAARLRGIQGLSTQERR